MLKLRIQNLLESPVKVLNHAVIESSKVEKTCSALGSAVVICPAAEWSFPSSMWSVTESNVLSKISAVATCWELGTMPPAASGFTAGGRVWCPPPNHSRTQPDARPKAQRKLLSEDMALNQWGGTWTNGHAIGYHDVRWNRLHCRGWHRNSERPKSSLLPQQTVTRLRSKTWGLKAKLITFQK